MSRSFAVARAAQSRPPAFHFNAAISAFMLAFVLFVAGSHMAAAHEFKAGDLEIEHPWSRATPAGAKVGGGYLTITNNGSTPDRLVAITSDISDKAELHQMAVKDGVMTMRPVEGGLEIPAGGKVDLKPGAFHLMFVGLKHPLKQGESFSATLAFEKAGSVEVTFAVEALGSTGEH